MRIDGERSYDDGVTQCPGKGSMTMLGVSNYYNV